MNSTSKEQIEKNVKTGKTATSRNSDLTPKAKCSVTAVDGKLPENDVTSRKKYNSFLRSSFIPSKVPVRLKQKTGGHSKCNPENEKNKKINEISKSKTIDRFNSKEVRSPQKDKTNVHVCRKISGIIKESPQTHSNVKRSNFNSATENAKGDKKCLTKVSALLKRNNSILKGTSMNNLKSDIDDVSEEKGKIGFKNVGFGCSALIRKNLLLRKSFSSGNLVRSESVNFKELKERLRKGAQIPIPIPKNASKEGKIEKELTMKSTRVCKDVIVDKKAPSKIGDDGTLRGKVVSRSEHIPSNVHDSTMSRRQQKITESRTDVVEPACTCEGSEILTGEKGNRFSLNEQSAKYEMQKHQNDKISSEDEKSEISSEQDKIKFSAEISMKKDLSQEEDNISNKINDSKIFADTQSDKNYEIKRSERISFEVEDFEISPGNQNNAVSSKCPDSKFSPKQQISGIFATTKNSKELLNSNNTLNKPEELQKISFDTKITYDDDCSIQEKNNLINTVRSNSAHETINAAGVTFCEKSDSVNQNNSCLNLKTRRKSIVEEVDEKLNTLKAKFLQQLENDAKQCLAASQFSKVSPRKSKSLEPTSQVTNALNCTTNASVDKNMMEANGYHTDQSSELKNILKNELSSSKSEEANEKRLTTKIPKSPNLNNFSHNVTPPFRSSKIPIPLPRLNRSLSPLIPAKISVNALRKSNNHSTSVSDETMPRCSYTSPEYVEEENAFSDIEELSDDGAFSEEYEVESHKIEEHIMEERKIKLIPVQKSDKDKSSGTEHIQKCYTLNSGNKNVIAFFSINSDKGKNVGSKKIEQYEILEIENCEECKTMRRLPPELLMKWQAMKEHCSSEINHNLHASAEGIKDTEVTDDGKIETTPLLQESQDSGSIWKSIMALPFKEFTISFCMFIFVCIVCFQIEDMNPILYT